MSAVWKLDVRLPRDKNSNSHDARPVHLIITTVKWIRTIRLSMKEFLSLLALTTQGHKWKFKSATFCFVVPNECVGPGETQLTVCKDANGSLCPCGKCGRLPQMQRGNPYPTYRRKIGAPDRGTKVLQNTLVTNL